MPQTSKTFTNCSLLLGKPGLPVTRENGTTKLFTIPSRRGRELYVSEAAQDESVLFGQTDT